MEMFNIVEIQEVTAPSDGAAWVAVAAGVAIGILICC